MKKVLTLVIAAAMLTASCVTAYAKEINQDSAEPQNGLTTIGMTVDPSYTVVIPESVVLTAQTDGTYSYDAQITATNIRLNKDDVINVKISSDFKLENAQGADAVDYTLTVDGAQVSNGGKVAEFATNADLSLVQSSALKFSAEKPTYAGDYSDTVTFSISVENAT